MQKEIKFRIWQTCWDDEELQIMHPIKGIDFEKQIYWVTTSSAGYNFKDAILMQCTGLKDSKGIDVYEGDILREKPENKWEQENFVAFEVFFHDGDANTDYNIGYNMCRTHYFGSVCGTHYVPSFKPKNVSKMQVIGNIYQNPELINN